MRYLCISLIALSLAAFLLASCASRQTAATLNDVETYIQERPDSALATVRAIDTTSLATRSLRAHYALLFAGNSDENAPPLGYEIEIFLLSSSCFSLFDERRNGGGQLVPI